MNWTSQDKVIVQGITEPQAAFLALQMKADRTDIVAGVSPGNGGTEVGDIPVFDLVEQVLTQVDTIDISLIFVDSYQVLDAAKEAIAWLLQRSPNIVVIPGTTSEVHLEENMTAWDLIEDK